MFEQIHKTDQDVVEMKEKTVFETERNKEKIDLYFNDLSYGVTIKYKASRCSFYHQSLLILFLFFQRDQFFF